MRRIILAILLAAGVMYVILHCNLWRTNSYWLPPTDFDRKMQLMPCTPKPSNSTLVKREHPRLQTPPVTTTVMKKEPEKTSLWQGMVPLCSESRLQQNLKEENEKLNLPVGSWLAGYGKVCTIGNSVQTIIGGVAAATAMFPALYPFLCSHNFQQVSELHGSFSFELPYGIRRAERFFQLALSKLSNCGLFTEDDSNPSCKKCVVVGNGGVLRNKSLGETIDSFDVVIRMNNGPVVGYEEDVGRRTTYRLFYPESVFSDPIHYDPNTTAVLVVFKPHDLKWLWDLLSGQRLIKTSAFWKKPALQLIYNPQQIRILDPAITRRTAHDFLNLPTKFSRHERPKHPTTGLIAITFALQICSEVHLAGFKYNLNDRNSSLHYYGNDTMSQMIQNAYHDIAVEQRFLKELIDHRILINLT